MGIAARETVVDEISDRTSEMTCDRQKSDPEFLLIGCGRVFGIEQMQIQPCVRERMTVSHAIAIVIKIFRIDINAAEVFDCREQGQRFLRG